MKPKGIRIQKAIAQAGLASRRSAERMIRAGSVRVNGQVVRELGTCVTAGEDTLEVEGRPVRWELGGRREVWAFYKPKRCVTTLDDPEGRATVKDFFPRTRARLIPVGRLDYDAEGLLLLTNDGDFANRVAHPSHGISKTYLVKVKGLVSSETLLKLKAGPTLHGRKRMPVRGRVLHNLADKTWVEVTLQEGINHHIKKMFAAAGHRVLKIKRYQIGGVALEALNPGESRKLEIAEIEALLGDRTAPEKPGPRGGSRVRRRSSGGSNKKSPLRVSEAELQRSAPSAGGGAGAAKKRKKTGA